MRSKNIVTDNNRRNLRIPYKILSICFVLICVLLLVSSTNALALTTEASIFIKLEELRNELLNYHTDLEQAVKTSSASDIDVLVTTGLLESVYDSLCAVKVMQSFILISSHLNESAKDAFKDDTAFIKIKMIISEGIKTNRVLMDLKLRMSLPLVESAKRQHNAVIGNNYRATLRKILALTEGL